MKIIKTNKDYQKALLKIESLWDSKPGTAKFDELELLAILVEYYERNKYKIAASLIGC